MTRLLFIFLFLPLWSSAEELYHFTIDLVGVKNDKVKVTLAPPVVAGATALYVMPDVIPGSYAKKNYGRFLEKFSAYDKDGKKLSVIINENRDFIIDNSNAISRIEYFVNDTWDDRDVSNIVFQPGGTNFQKDRNYMLNNFALCGYFEGMKDLPFRLTFIHSQETYGSTFLTKTKSAPGEDTFEAPDYFELSDNPVMYCKADTNSFTIDSTHIYVSVFSNGNKVNSATVSNQLKPLAEALKKFLGKLPVEEYHFLFYFASSDQEILESKSGLGGFGALEHNHCSFYFLPEPTSEEGLHSLVHDICAHEFMHTLTPLHLHSKEIADFNFRTPNMSKHLWLYEGATEYFSLLVRLQSGLITEADFLDEMSEKIMTAVSYPLFSMTEMSKNVIDENHQKNYLSVYSKGALLAWMLDMYLLHLSNGGNSLKDVVVALASKYGPDKPFNDDELINEIVAMTYPEVRTFFDDYIIGMKAINYKDFLKLGGYNFYNAERITQYKVGPIILKYNRRKNEIRIVNSNELIGCRPGDVIYKINEEVMTYENLYRLFNRYFAQNTDPNPFALTVKRKGEAINLVCVPFAREDDAFFLIITDKNALPEELEVRSKIKGS